jgi:cold-inducible RNA-binding protein
LAVRLFVGNLAYSTTEADLRTYFGEVAPPSQVVLPVDRETGRPRGFAFVEFLDRAHAEQAIQRFHGQPFNGRPLAVSEARAREDRGPGGPRPGGFSGPRPGGYSSPRPGGFAPRPPPGSFGGPRPFDGSGGAAGAPSNRSRNFGPDAKPQRGGSAKSKKKGDDKPRGPIPLKNTGRSFSLDDVDAIDEPLPDIDDVATSKPTTDDEIDGE